MPKNTSIKKVVVIGSGPIVIGQAALNIAMELEESGFLREHNVKLIGTSSKTIKKAEDRLEFKRTMEKINEPCAPSEVVTNIKDGLAFVEKIGYPIVLRPAYLRRQRRWYCTQRGGVRRDTYERTQTFESWSGSC